ncbi:DUF6461 domain-containing protein [Embleya hyalina]|uniref:Uncharacterized protein n=1 Tax=Embleya hyalina TaxID=516124 RepID=A0A401Z5V1_9ACTN|nr:DUF6461 domain-containing protein [Embleya hyalina]GCE02240.1 hypothetical protein EHYA_10017 [Embleya hyalina]
MSAATAADYGWIRSSFVFPQGIEVGYCLMLVRGVPPEKVLRVMGAEPRGGCRGAVELFERQEELFAGSDEWDESFLAGVCAVPGEGGDWALVLHFDGGIGMRPRFLEVLSAGSRAVTHASNGGKPIHTFAWYEDGELRTGFDWPTLRHGSTPDDLVPLMHEAGFDMGEESDADTYDRKAAVLALAVRLTGVRLTEDLLDTSAYRLGHVPEEPADEDGTGVVIDFTDANGDGFHKEVIREHVEHALQHHRTQRGRPLRRDET